MLGAFALQLQKLPIFFRQKIPIFAEKLLRAFVLQKFPTFFRQKMPEFLQTFNVSLSNDIISFEQPGPVL